MRRRFPDADDSRSRWPFCEAHDQKTLLSRVPDDQLASLVVRMIRIVEDASELISKNRQCFFERHSVLLEILARLRCVPLELRRRRYAHLRCSQFSTRASQRIHTVTVRLSDTPDKLSSVRLRVQRSSYTSSAGLFQNSSSFLPPSTLSSSGSLRVPRQKTPCSWPGCTFCNTLDRLEYTVPVRDLDAHAGSENDTAARTRPGHHANAWFLRCAEGPSMPEGRVAAGSPTRQPRWGANARSKRSEEHWTAPSTAPCLKA